MHLYGYILVGLCVISTGNCCPELCSCDDSLTVVDCTGVGLSAVPEDLPESVVELKLAENSISSIGAGAFSDTPKLQNLHLSHNLIHNISTGSFASVTELKKIDLSCNNLTTLGAGTFPLAKLLELNLTGNSLRHLPERLFVQCHQLNNLFLADNQLTQSVFHLVNEEVPWLKNLDISRNALDIVPYLALKKMALLLFLQLKDSMITEIDSNAFIGLQSLQFLDLSGNSIQRLAREMFQPLDQVAHLEISGNDVICECSVKQLQDWLKETSVYMESPAECKVAGTEERLDIESGELDFLCTADDEVIVPSSTTVSPLTEPSAVAEATSVDPVTLGLAVSLLVVFLVAVFLLVFVLCKVKKPKPLYASVRKKAPSQSQGIQRKVPDSAFMAPGDPYENIAEDASRQNELNLTRMNVHSSSHSQSVPNLFALTTPLPKIPGMAQETKMRRFTKPMGMNTAKRGQRPPWLTEKATTESQFEPEPPPLRGSTDALHNASASSEHLLSDADPAVTYMTQELVNPYEEIPDSSLVSMRVSSPH